MEGNEVKLMNNRMKVEISTSSLRILLVHEGSPRDETLYRARRKGPGGGIRLGSRNMGTLR